jgi:hypothetical protein
MTLTLIGSLALLDQGIAAAAEPVAAQAAQPPIRNDTGKRICRSVTPTGSRFTKRVCRTSDEWQRDSDSAQRSVEEIDMSKREFQPACGVGCGPH